MLGVAEYLLGRPVRSVLDLGCGEAPWRAHLRRLRPGLHYLGVDPSEYVVRRFGRRRNIRRGTFGGLRELRLERRYDVVVCSDVLQYLPTSEVERGLAEVRRLTAGVAYLDVFASEDAVVGDTAGWHDRSAAHYRRLFRRAGLTPVGMHCYVGPAAAADVAALERRG